MALNDKMVLSYILSDFYLDEIKCTPIMLRKTMLPCRLIILDGVCVLLFTYQKITTIMLSKSNDEWTGKFLAPK